MKYWSGGAKNGLFPLETLAANIRTYQASGGSSNFQDYFEQHYQLLKVLQRLRER